MYIVIAGVSGILQELTSTTTEIYLTEELGYHDGEYKMQSVEY